MEYSPGMDPSGERAEGEGAQVPALSLGRGKRGTAHW